jgi:sulfatase maturation enzyme AslB (radical SAM superfamily)
LGKLGITIDFCLDGSKHTHSIYRQGTNFDKIISNAKIFMDSGGIAYWRLIEFQHNKDEIETLRITSHKLGFRKFIVIKNTRGQLPAYDSKGRLVSTIDNYNKEELIIDKLSKRKTDVVLLEDITIDRVPCDIKCEVAKSKELYISSTGDVYPCCYLGFEPNTYGHGNYFEPVNTQIKSLIGRNNAITYEINECISWFIDIKNTWDIKTFENGRLVACNDNCGECNN